MKYTVIKEVYPNPTVKQVIFEVRFNDLFFIESKIGELQLKVTDRYPNPQILFEKKFVLVGKSIQEEVKQPLPEEFDKKIWVFKADKNYRFDVTSKSLSITSSVHKTYNLNGAEKFRDEIKFVLDSFLEVLKINTFNRIGLRYVDECPLPKKDNETLQKYYNSAYPMDRFDLANAEEMFFRTVERRGEVNISYMEELRKVNNDYKLILDFDGFAFKIPSKDYITTTDKLHDLISDVYEHSIKEPVYKFMKNEKNE